MAFTVHVRNFQSIEDATLNVEGFTVVTGRNNGGKTAVFRAISGLFQNTPGTKYVRHGADHSSVDLTFEDGTRLVWEKGPKVNRYKINGKEINKVSRTVPPEVLDFGVRPIQVGAENLWPQFAPQFDGQLFLVNKPGSVLAESLADVERVGRLNDALRLCQSDKRSVGSEIKIRTEDLRKIESAVNAFAGLDIASDLVQEATRLEKAHTELVRQMEDLKILSGRLTRARALVQSFAGLSSVAIPEDHEMSRCSLAFETLLWMQTNVSKVLRLRKLLDVMSHVRGASIPQDILNRSQKIVALFDWLSKVARDRKRVMGTLSNIQSLRIPRLPDSSDLSRLRRDHNDCSELRALHRKRLELQRVLEDIRKESALCSESLDQSVAEVKECLGDMKVCPTCGSYVHSNHENE